MANFLNDANPFDSRASLESNLARLQAMQAGQTATTPAQPSGRFGQLADFVASLPEDKAAWTAQQTVVQEKVSTMLAIFLNKFLFEQGKTQFEDWCKTNKIPIVDEYVDIFVQTAKGYVNPLDTQTQEIAELKRIISEMQNGKAREML